MTRSTPRASWPWLELVLGELASVRGIEDEYECAMSRRYDARPPSRRGPLGVRVGGTSGAGSWSVRVVRAERAHDGVGFEVTLDSGETARIVPGARVGSWRPAMLHEQRAPGWSGRIERAMVVAAGAS